MHIILGTHTCMRPFDLRRHEICNVACPVWGRPAKLVLPEVMRVCEPTEREVEDSGDLNLR